MSAPPLAVASGPYWATVEENFAIPYLPQLKDSVTYFCKSHFDFIRKQGRKLRERLDYQDLLLNHARIDGIIEEVEYLNENVPCCKLALKINLKRKNHLLKFKYYFGLSQPDYLVLKSAIAAASSFSYRQNETVNLVSRNYPSETGTILEIFGNLNDACLNIGCYKIHR